MKKEQKMEEIGLKKENRGRKPTIISPIKMCLYLNKHSLFILLLVMKKILS